MTDSYLLLWLEAPLQSWGYDSRFGRRDSLDFPTKSGVLGLLCCARGAGGEEREWLAQWADCDMQVVAYVPKGRDGNPTDRLPLLGDFHMVGSGYNQKDKYEKLMIPKKSDGKPASNTPGTKMTYRYYLQDMAYAVALQGPDTLVQEAGAALIDPVWDLFLGRKNCAPTEFIFQGLLGSAQEALCVAEKLAESKNRAASFMVRQGVHEGDILELNDVPVRFGPRKEYRDRRVTVMPVEFSNGG